MALALLWVGLMVVSPSLDDVRRAAREATGKSEIQTQLPGAPAAPDTPDTPRASRPSEAKPPASIPTPAGGFVNGAAYVLLIGIGMGLVLLAARWLWAELRDRRRAAPLATASPPAAPAPEPIPPGAADALAARGRWGEAMHALLVSVLEREISPTPPRSFTSREVISGLPAPARGPLGELVRRVEVVHFGGAPAGEADWRRCRELAREAGVLR